MHGTGRPHSRRTQGPRCPVCGQPVAAGKQAAAKSSALTLAGWKPTERSNLEFWVMAKVCNETVADVPAAQGAIARRIPVDPPTSVLRAM
jgi:hypothetical protein